VPDLPRRLLRVLQPDEIETLFGLRNPNTAIGARWNALLAFALDTGVRLTELITLRLDQLDLDRRFAHVVGKGDEERRVRFGDRAYLALTRYINLFRARERNAATVFVGLEGDPLTVNGAEKIIQEIRRETSLQHLTWHRLRHTFATYFLATEQGDVQRLRELMGHKDITTTMKYIHVSEQLRESLGMLGNMRPIRPTLLDGLGVETTPRVRASRRRSGGRGSAVR